ncbi:hypothetical protein QUF64_00665 [Anaerolineales bacterium HSG6]|nr:hypothetical protein [Anaerolineales bacterium HSG6]MDM8532305.1 hypothetical protein [Anaerolineales bacterium HSG25]
MSKNARNQLDKRHSFVELHQLWKQGTYTIEECITQVLHGLLRFEERKNRLAMKLVQYRPSEEELAALNSPESSKFKADTQQLLAAIQTDKSATYEAMDFVLENLTTLEISFLHHERECEAMFRLMDDKQSHLN